MAIFLEPLPKLTKVPSDIFGAWHDASDDAPQLTCRRWQVRIRTSWTEWQRAWKLSRLCLRGDSAGTKQPHKRRVKHGSPEVKVHLLQTTKTQQPEISFPQFWLRKVQLGTSIDPQVYPFCWSSTSSVRLNVQIRRLQKGKEALTNVSFLRDINRYIRRKKSNTATWTTLTESQFTRLRWGF